MLITVTSFDILPSSEMTNTFFNFENNNPFNDNYNTMDIFLILMINLYFLTLFKLLYSNYSIEHGKLFLLPDIFHFLSDSSWNTQACC